MWRLFGEFRHRTAYLDIETSGSFPGEVTVIGVYDGNSVKSFVNGRNLEEFQDEILTTFDVPVLRKWFRRLSLPPAHLDLRFALKRIGLKGGLKSIEKQAGIYRDSSIDGLDGYDAILLWDAYQWGDEQSLERLIRYNAADIVSLEALAELAYNRLSAELIQ